MSTVAVWVLVIFSHGYRERSVAVIDNISTRAECVRLSGVVDASAPNTLTTRCVETIKVKP